MMPDNIRNLLDREPFIPFRLVMSSGQHYDVSSPSFVMVLKSEVFIAFPDGERWAHVPFLHIASIETGTNGQGRRRKRPKKRG